VFLSHHADARMTTGAYNKSMTTLQSPALFDADSATPAERLAVAELIAECFAFAYPDDPPLIAAQMATELSFVTPGERIDQFVIWEGERALAHAKLEYSLEQNLHTGQAGILVRPDVRRRGLGQRMFTALSDQARQAGHRLMTFVTSDRAPAGEPFAARQGASVALINRRSQLDLASLDAALLERWLVRPADDPFQLHTWQIVPDALLEQMAGLSMVMNTAPRGDIEMDDWRITPEMIRAWEVMIKESGEVRHTLAIRDTRTGQLVGFSDTYWNPLRAAVIGQGATAVRPEARGQGLGKWLKAAMLRQVVTECPGARYVRTSNAEQNAAMLGINVALGFTPWSSTTEWQLTL
jgi:mycothiol synthase